MEAIILAGGLGIRLSALVPGILKPLAPVLDRPFFLEFIHNILNNDFKSLTLSIN